MRGHGFETHQLQHLVLEVLACTYCNNLLQDFIEAIEALPEFDKPLYFGLPENIERSSQRMISSQVVTQLRVLKRADAKASKFDKDVWANELGPLLNLWKKLNTVSLSFASTTRKHSSRMRTARLSTVSLDIPSLTLKK